MLFEMWDDLSALMTISFHLPFDGHWLTLCFRTQQQSEETAPDE
jgi:hypothetical protein|tara:strand:+ start:341 stop:472 length:132 start_codon:yes stop_codon:yes gene_type:complete